VKLATTESVVGGAQPFEVAGLRITHERSKTLHSREKNIVFF
jgi:hypothetical protein